MKNLAFTSRGRILMAAHSAVPPSDLEWQGFLDALERHGVEGARLLVWTDGAAPNLAQREAFDKLLAGRTVTVAVLASSTFVRGVATAISWFNPTVKVFPPDKVEEALGYLGVTGPFAAKLADSFADVCAEVRGPRREAR
jgi:hypothetical protein